MIYRIFSITAKPGKMPEARQLALEFTAHVVENYGHKMEVLSNISGPSSQLHWVGRYESLADLEAMQEKWNKDPKIQEVRAKIPELFENDSEFSLFRVES